MGIIIINYIEIKIDILKLILFRINFMSLLIWIILINRFMLIRLRMIKITIIIIDRKIKIKKKKKIERIRKISLNYLI